MFYNSRIINLLYRKNCRSLLYMFNCHVYGKTIVVMRDDLKDPECDVASRLEEMKSPESIRTIT